ncbi:MAG: hypothetical protein QM662_10000 [Gordonia sp. (in: high G+C Gram-positive bacteria)]
MAWLLDLLDREHVHLLRGAVGVCPDGAATCHPAAPDAPRPPRRRSDQFSVANS